MLQPVQPVSSCQGHWWPCWSHCRFSVLVLLDLQQHLSLLVTSSWNACFSWLPGQCPPWEDLNGFSSTCSFFLDFQILGCPRTHFSSPFILTSVVILSGLRTWNITYKLESPRFLSLTQISALIPDTCIQLPHLHLHWIDTSKITGPHLTSHLPYTIASLTVFLSGLMVTNCSGWKYNLQCLFFFFFFHLHIQLVGKFWRLFFKTHQECENYCHLHCNHQTNIIFHLLTISYRSLLDVLWIPSSSTSCLYTEVRVWEPDQINLLRKTFPWFSTSSWLFCNCQYALLNPLTFI